MSIYITDDQLESKLARLAARQLVPVKKTAMATAILREAVRNDRGEPIDKWMDKIKKFDADDHTTEAA